MPLEQRVGEVHEQLQEVTEMSVEREVEDEVEDTKMTVDSEIEGNVVGTEMTVEIEVEDKVEGTEVTAEIEVEEKVAGTEMTAEIEVEEKVAGTEVTAEIDVNEKVAELEVIVEKQVEGDVTEIVDKGTEEVEKEVIVGCHVAVVYGRGWYLAKVTTVEEECYHVSYMTASRGKWKCGKNEKGMVDPEDIIMVVSPPTLIRKLMDVTPEESRRIKSRFADMQSR